MNHKSKNRAGTKKWSKRFNHLSAYWYPRQMRRHIKDMRSDKDIKSGLKCFEKGEADEGANNI